MALDVTLDIKFFKNGKLPLLYIAISIAIKCNHVSREEAKYLHLKGPKNPSDLS